VVAVDDRRHRPTGGQPGESGLYSDEGDEIRLARGNVIIVRSDTVKLGSSSASDPVALKSDLDALMSAIAAAKLAVQSGDGGLAAFTALEETLEFWPAASQKVVAE